MTDQVTGSTGSRKGFTKPIKHFIGPFHFKSFPTLAPNTHTQKMCIFSRAVYSISWNGNSSHFSKPKYPRLSLHPQGQAVAPGVSWLIACAVWVSWGDVHTLTDWQHTLLTRIMVRFPQREGHCNVTSLALRLKIRKGTTSLLKIYYHI